MSEERTFYLHGYYAPSLDGFDGDVGRWALRWRSVPGDGLSVYFRPDYYTESAVRALLGAAP